MTHCYRYADASIIAPFDYVSMIWAATLGYLVFAETPSPSVLIGAGDRRSPPGSPCCGASARRARSGLRAQPPARPEERTNSVRYSGRIRLSLPRGFAIGAAAMGVEGKDRAKVLEAGAAALSEPARPRRAAAAQELRPVARRPFDPVGRRQVDHFADRAQRDQPDADDDLAARPRARRRRSSRSCRAARTARSSNISGAGRRRSSSRTTACAVSR